MRRSCAVLSAAHLFTSIGSAIVADCAVGGACRIRTGKSSSGEEVVLIKIGAVHRNAAQSVDLLADGFLHIRDNYC